MARTPDALVLDRRGLPVEERGPILLDALDGLAGDDVVVLLDDHEPRQLRELLVPLGFEYELVDCGDGSWLSRLTAPA